MRRERTPEVLIPTERDLWEQHALAGQARRQHHVVRAQAVGGDDQQAIAEVEHVPHLAGAIGFEPEFLRATECRGHGSSAPTTRRPSMRSDPRANDSITLITT